MRNYAKKIIFFIILFTLIFSVNFSLNIISNNKEKVIEKTFAVSPNTNFYKSKKTEAEEEFDTEDNTNFILSYQGKIWEYNSKIDNNYSNQFDLNFEINKYKSNNKSEKIKIINSLKNLKINNEIIINYLFPSLNKKINNIQKNIEKPAKSAYFKYNKSNNKIDIYDEQIGIKINLNLFYENILNNYCKNNDIKIEIPIEKIIPEITKEKLNNETKMRAKFSTNFSSSTADRKHNIRQAVKKINSYTLKPNETFSFNKVVGRRTEENGYRVAKIISQGELVDGMGGGVCQVSTTLYNAVLLSGLKIEQANKHSERVSYVQAGFDAMVNYGSSDLVFRNNTENNIHIYCDTSNDRVNINIFGESLKGYSYKLKNEITDIIKAGAEEVKIDTENKYIDKVEFSDEYFYLKHAKDGCTIKSFREVYFCGNLLRVEQLRADKYKPQNAIKIVGAKERPLVENLVDAIDNFVF